MTEQQKKTEEFAGKMLVELGAAAAGALIVLGDKLKLYGALAEAGPQTSAELAKRAGVNERYLREWLSANAASGYVEYDASSKKFSMSPEQVAVLADQNSPFFMSGGFVSTAAMYLDEPKVTEAFKTGRGVGWQEHSECLFCGTARFFGPIYRACIVSNWLPALDGVSEKLVRGARVVDVGCGHGLSTFIMAKAFPKSTFIGLDFHDKSIQDAREHAKAERLTNLSFEVADASSFAGQAFDLVTMFDCLHDMGDPVGASRHALNVLAPDGTLMIVEPKAGDSLEENLNPLGRAYYCFSTMICVPASLNQPVGAALGAQAGETRLKEVLQEAGFKRFRRATETPTSIVLEARP